MPAGFADTGSMEGSTRAAAPSDRLTHKLKKFKLNNCASPRKSTLASSLVSALKSIWNALSQAVFVLQERISGNKPEQTHKKAKSFAGRNLGRRSPSIEEFRAKQLC